MNHRPKILVTEDDFDNQKFLEVFLGKKFDVIICDSELTFYNSIQNNDFDLILMDISLKGKKNGLELTKELRNIPKYSNIPVVCLSAHAFQRDKENAMNAGVDIFLAKPVENEVLMNTLFELLEKKTPVLIRS